MDGSTAFRCFECGVALGGHHWRVCTVCGRMFCRRHLIVSTDTATCAACQADGERPVPGATVRQQGPANQD